MGAQGRRTIQTCAGLALAAGIAAALIGAWFWRKEAEYHAQFDNELAGVLQWVGVGLLLVGVAACALALAAWRAVRDT